MLSSKIMTYQLESPPILKVSVKAFSSETTFCPEPCSSGSEKEWVTPGTPPLLPDEHHSDSCYKIQTITIVTKFWANFMYYIK